MGISRTVIISCAGMGNRLGLGVTKALVEVEGKPLVIRLLEMLDDESDVRIIVGYQAEKLIDVVRKYRDDVIFVFNHDYRSTGAGASVALGAKYSNEYVLMIDGDLIIHPHDIDKMKICHHEFVSGGIITTDEPWMLKTHFNNGTEYVSTFSKESGKYEWNGIAQIRSERIKGDVVHAFHLIEPLLPLPFLHIRTREIDTQDDYERAVAWVKNNYADA